MPILIGNATWETKLEADEIGECRWVKRLLVNVGNIIQCFVLHSVIDLFSVCR